MKENEVFYAKTHAEFLNKNFATNYKAWMIRFDGRNRDGWKNSYYGDVIKDEILGTIELFGLI